ncbi:PTS transporter subunit EIIC [Priestia megaterium]|uniref:PTS transporter subunit EIIC n=1 Tax=Priestia megaterium TaxID=1404 RepID=UPI002E1F1922|nr:PTS transporter subunit EIIC [Priestia megaterium]MED4029816.1 PTS transporter subunit EIIC [Priestia megaterium]
MLTRMKDGVQTFGRSLLLPIALLAPIGLILGLSGALAQDYMIDKIPFLGNEILQTIIKNLRTITEVIFNNIPLLFAMGVAYGMSKNEKGIAVFSSVIGYLTLLIVINVWLTVTNNLATENITEKGQGLILGIQSLDTQAVGGIIAGLVAAKIADRFYKLELPLAFAFFSGKKSVPIITFLAVIPIGLFIPFIWEALTKFLISISVVFMNPYYGVGLYWFVEKLCIPFGLHHVLNELLRLTAAGGTYTIDGQEYTGILNAVNKILFQLGPNHESWSLMPTLTSYLGTGQMLGTLFRIPAIGLAMYHTAYRSNKQIAKGTILTLVLTAFLGNVTEPMEFSFLFIAPQLYFVYALLSGLTALPLNLLDITTSYIRGTIFDFGIFGLLYDKTNWIHLIILGLFNFVVFYFVFKFIIIKFNLRTPGREEEVKNSTLLKEKKYKEIAVILVDALGGTANLKNVDNCITRLRIDLNNQDVVDMEKIKDSGASGVFFPQKNHIHIVFGPHVEFVKNAIGEVAS